MSESEQEYDLPVPTETSDSQPDPEVEYEKAKQKCEDLGGEWKMYLHGDGSRHYTYGMRCWSRDDLPSGRGDPRWNEPGLLSYDLYVVYSIRTKEVVGLTRFDSESKEKLADGPDWREVELNAIFRFSQVE